MATEYDALIGTPDVYSGLTSLSESTKIGSHNRGPFKNNDISKVDESRDTFCKRRGIALMICFAFLTIALIITILFSSQFSSLFDKSENHILYERYENDWDSLEHVDEKWIPNGWNYDTECDNEHNFDLTFAVKLQNTDKLEGELMKTSHPDSPTYGQHWTKEEIDTFFAPKEESISEVLKWIDYHGIDKSSVSFLTKRKDYIRVNVDCQTANKMLNTKFGFWSNIGTNSKFAASNSGEKGHLRVKSNYKVPKIVKKHLDFISPTLRFPSKRHTSKVELISSLGKEEHYADEKISADVLSSYVTPNRLTDMYCLSDYQDPSSKKNKQAIASFLDEWFIDSDYYLFQTYFEVTRTKVTRSPDFQPEGYGDEAELDVQYITSTGRGIDTIVYDIEDDLYFITLAERIADSDDPPFVVSISYGGGEQSNGWGYCFRANIDFGIVSLLGVTFFVSSGDDGAAGDTTCDDYDAYQPSFPATSQYVTAVGGTIGGKSPDDCDSDYTNTGEEAWYWGGGGFSVYFDRMSFQDSAVEDYFNSDDISFPTSSLYNADGRAYPDISAISVYYIVCIEQSLYSVSGTSCSSPAVAGMISQINDIRLQNGLSSLGWLGPRLYNLYDKSPKYYFNDVIEGYNMGCSCDDDVGFEATQGWDPATGVGTPKISKMAPSLIYK